MNQGQEEKPGAMPLLEAWMKSAAKLWGSLASMCTDASVASDKPTEKKKGGRTRVEESMASALKMWRTLSSFMSQPEATDTLFQGINALPEIISKMARTGWDVYFRLQQQWMERMGPAGMKTEAYTFENLDQDALKAWTDIYEQEFRQFLNIPQLGLSRFYQERLSRFTDKFNLFQGSMTQFMYLLYLPLEKSLIIMQERLEELTAEGKLPENPQDYYRMWLKILEGHYMTLFKSPEYTHSLGDTLNTMEEFLLARQKVLEDILQSLPVPTYKDMDDLYKELYHLKKKVKQLEKGSSK